MILQKIIMNYSKEELVESLWIDIFPLDGMPSNALKKKNSFFEILVRKDDGSTLAIQ